MKNIEYIIACSCGGSMRLELTPRAQQKRRLSKTSTILIDLFEALHEEHGTVTQRFSDEDDEQPAESEGKE